MSVPFLPEGPVYLFRYIDVVDNGKAQEEPVIADPDNDQDIQQGGDAKPDVFSFK